jgi:hypothetical protein
MRIAICIPAHGDTRAAFTLSLSRMLLHTVREWPLAMPGDPLLLEIFMGSGGVVALVRERLFEAAGRWGAEWILWLDSDQSFPPDTLVRLAAAREPVIGANIPRRSPDATPTAETLDAAGRRQFVWTTPEKIAAGTVEPVHQLGLGVCLTAMNALDRLPRPLFDELREDQGLMRKLREAGHRPMVDHRLSAEVGHVGTYTWTNAHSLATRARGIKRVELEAAPGAAPVSGRIEP